MLINLIGNAVKFTDAGSVSLKVETGASDGSTTEIIVTVSDTGIGIGIEDQDRLFQPFQQADPSTTRRQGGTGLGLSIIKGLAQQMGGDITLKETPGGGATFEVDLPKKAGVAAPASVA